ncbi:MAG: glycosyltransferase family A protein [Thermodesulfovibrionales bacterium]
MFGFRRKNKVKISIITWDGSFRESFHTVDTFGDQDFPAARFEFIWVDFYANDNPKLLERISRYPNARLLNLNHNKSIAWHLGVCFNAGIREATGDILLLVDGDIIVQKNLLDIVEEEHSRYEDLVLYFRRWDEPTFARQKQRSYEVDYLDKICILNNPTNYGGALAIKKCSLAEVNNYEESEFFSGPGANGLEMYTRLRNNGFPIKWHNQKIFHPYHALTGFTPTDRGKMNELSRQFPWINPYAGIEQSWVIKSREMDLSFWADKRAVDNYLAKLPTALQGYAEKVNVGVPRR